MYFYVQLCACSVDDEAFLRYTNVATEEFVSREFDETQYEGMGRGIDHRP